MGDKNKTRQHRRHPLQVTADRLGDHLLDLHEQLTGAERDEISRVRNMLIDFAEKQSAWNG